MRHVISVLMANEAGALVRVAGMFSQRGFNIESLNVAPTEDATVSRLTLATSGTEDVVDQINRQLLKLVDVIDVIDMTGDEHLEIELALVKVLIEAGGPTIDALADPYDVAEVSRHGDLATLRYLGKGADLNRFVAILEDAGVLVELARSGAVTMTPGAEGLQYHDPNGEASARF